MLTLVRLFSDIDGTIGMLYKGRRFLCYTMEPPWRNNRPNISCIPQGEYEVEYLARSSSGKYKDCYWIKGVRGRKGILFHKGNLVTDTHGCVLPGLTLGTLKGRLAVLKSRQAVALIHSVTNRKGFRLNVRDSFIHTK